VSGVRRVHLALLASLTAGCLAAPGAQDPAAAPASRDIDVAGRAFREIPAGEFEFEGRRVFLPAFWIAVELGATAGADVADATRVTQCGPAPLSQTVPKKQ